MVLRKSAMLMLVLVAVSSSFALERAAAEGRGDDPSTSAAAVAVTGAAELGVAADPSPAIDQVTCAMLPALGPPAIG